MTILTFTQSNKTYYINAAMIVSFTAAQQGGGTVIALANQVNQGVDQTPAEVLAAINPPAPPAA